MRRVDWVNHRTRKSIQEFPREVQQEIAIALRLAAQGDKADYAKPLKGFHGSSVLEIVVDEGGGTYRAVYTVQLADAIWVLHAFQKKSKKGIATPRKEIDLIRERLKQAQQLSDDRLKGKG